MDTRRKILSAAAAERLRGPVTLVSGYFDVLRAEHTRALEQVRRPLLVAVLRHPDEIFEADSRAELIAALRVVDYVVTTDHDELDSFIERLRPAAVVRLEAADLSRARRLRQDVQRSQKR